jgi:hypothetical protein
MEGIDLLAKLSPDQLKVLSPDQINAIFGGRSAFVADMATIKQYLIELMRNADPAFITNNAAEINRLFLKYASRKFYICVWWPHGNAKKNMIEIFDSDEYVKSACYHPNLEKFCEIYKGSTFQFSNTRFSLGCNNIIIIKADQMDMFDQLNKAGIIATNIH